MAWVAYDTDNAPPITTAEQENNVNIIAAYFRGLGWTDNAIAAMLGNMQVESFLNPCQFQMGGGYSLSSGFGLVQWTPATKFTTWAGSDWRTNYNKQLQRIKYELDNGLQWQTYPINMTFYDFTQSTLSVDYLTEVFLRDYENPLDWTASIALRRTYANNWYTYLGNNPSPQIPIWMLFKLRWNNGGRT